MLWLEWGIVLEGERRELEKRRERFPLVILTQGNIFKSDSSSELSRHGEKQAVKLLVRNAPNGKVVSDVKNSDAVGEACTMCVIFSRQVLRTRAGPELVAMS